MVTRPTGEPVEALWFLIRNPGRKQGPRSRVKILLPDDRLALWGMVSHLLVFRKDKFSAMSPSLYCTYC